MVYIFLADGFEEIEALAPYDLLKRAEIPVQLVSIMGEREVCSVHDLVVKTDVLFEEADFDSCEMIVLPGGLPGADRLAAHAALYERLQEFLATGRKVSAICAAPARVLGDKGLLKGRKATAYPGNEDALIGAEVSNDPVVVDGNLITSQGPGTAMAFGIAIIESLADGETVRAVAEKALYNKVR